MAELARLPDATLVTVRCSQTVLEAIAIPGGLTFPLTPNRFSNCGSHTVLWTGPDDWLVIAGDEPTTLLASLEHAFAGHQAAIVETSGNRVRYSLSGGGAREMMARACSLDLDPGHFEVGDCAGTLVARAQAYIMQRMAAPAYEIVVRRSFSNYLQDWFRAAGCSII